ncbi:hypothetical protein HANVADRAFT_120466 [Hanseniaspora valbyensis NRRL Y-1626]|uniref:Uncharacterized protein n=1 Tax=Hanseniaspora valbyensis NRRL Y-1626 TaxID=766949 RepID=A0A1B7TBH7_9ASCO|nr:hypothetical protein HANVADRAFT_120466 [Hanseniaspora valbyensis NRRL Y-1626]
MPEKNQHHHKKHKLKSSLMIQEMLRKEREADNNNIINNTKEDNKTNTTVEKKETVANEKDVNMDESEISNETQSSETTDTKTKTVSNKINSALLQERLKKQKALLSQHKTEKQLADMFLNPSTDNNSENIKNKDSFNEFTSGFSGIDINKVNNMFKN